VSVEVPASSANLGAGFDCLAVALGLVNRMALEVRGWSRGEIELTVDGEGSGELPADRTNRCVQGIEAALREVRGELPDGVGWRISMRNEVPLARGLGSSAAATVAGVVAGNHFLGEPLTAGDLLRLATAIEGHPDNAAAALLGGLTIAWQQDGAARAVRRDVDAAVLPVVLIPPLTASTELARGLLPVTVPHGDAAFAAGRAALLVAALTGTPQALFDATEDRLHQSYRAPAMPESHALVEALRANGHAAVISGAGPTVLVLARGELEARAALEAAPEGWTAQALGVDPAGAERIS